MTFDIINHSNFGDHLRVNDGAPACSNSPSCVGGFSWWQWGEGVKVWVIVQSSVRCHKSWHFYPFYFVFAWTGGRWSVFMDLVLLVYWIIYKLLCSPKQVTWCNTDDIQFYTRVPSHTIPARQSDSRIIFVWLSIGPCFLIWNWISLGTIFNKQLLLKC